MSTSAKTGIVVIVIIILVIIGWVWYANSRSAAPITPADNTASTTATAPVVQDHIPTAADSVAGTGLTAQANVSNADLDTDASAVDAQMNNLTTDNASVDQSMSASATQ